MGHGATDAAWGILSGPAGVADAITGGNIGGLLKAGSAAVMQGAGLAGQWLGSRFSSGDSAVEPAPIDTAPIEKFGGQMSDGTMARW